MLIQHFRVFVASSTMILCNWNVTEVLCHHHIVSTWCPLISRDEEMGLSFIDKNYLFRVLTTVLAGTFASISSGWWPFNIFPGCQSCVWKARRTYRYFTSWCPSRYLSFIWREQVFSCIFFCSYNGGWLCTEVVAGKRVLLFFLFFQMYSLKEQIDFTVLGVMYVKWICHP